MPKGQALFYSVSGMAAARAKPLYEALKKKLPERFPHLKIAFVGCPFTRDGKRKLPLPLLWTLEERNAHPTTRVFSFWKRMNPSIIEIIRPALEKNDISVALRLGFDGFEWATSRCDDEEAIKEAEVLHHELVKARIVALGVKPPRYFIPVADEEDVANLVDAFPQLRGYDPRTLREFMRHEKTMLARYFDPKHGQKTPVMLPLSMSIDEMVEEAIAVIEQDLKGHGKAA